MRTLGLLLLIGCENISSKGEEITEVQEPSEPGEPGQPDDPDEITLDNPDHDWDGDGYTENDGDCNDNDKFVNPGATEQYYDDFDQNCDDLSDFDADEDGFEAADWGGGDCDDFDDSIYPDAPDDPTDGVDSNCDGVSDPRFVTEVIDPNCLYCSGPSTLGIDSNNRLHVVYEDDGQLWYSSSEGIGNWRTPTLLKTEASSQIATYGLDGAVDGQNRFHLTYSAALGSGMSVQYNVMQGIGQWATEVEIEGPNTTRTDSGYDVKIGVGGDSLPVFGFYNQSANYPYMSKLSTIPFNGETASLSYRYEADYLAWSMSNNGIGRHTGLAVGTDNVAHLVYLDGAAPYGTGNNPQMQYSSYNHGSICESDTVGNGGSWTNMAMRNDNVPCVVYQDQDNLSLSYACKISGCAGWSVETVDPAFNNGAYADIAFNSYNQPYISYYDGNQGALKIATRPGNSWEYHVLDDGPKDVGRFTSINVDSLDRVHVIYQNATDASIWHAIGR